MSPQFFNAILWLFDPSRLVLFALVLGRVSGLVMLAPIYGSANVPMRLRALFALALTLLIVPVQMHVSVPQPGTMLAFLTYMAGELVIGLVLGFGVWVYLQAFQLAGQVISQSAGMSLADVFIPGLDTSIPVISQLLYLFALVVFVTIGGHRLVMAGFLETFTTLPPGEHFFSREIVQTLTTMLSQSFQLGIRVAAPGLTALLLATLVMGLISRTLPQLNIMVFGFGVNALFTLAVLALSLGAAAWALEDEIEMVVDRMVSLAAYAPGLSGG